MPGGDEVIARFAQWEVARLGQDFEAYVETCNSSTGRYNDLVNAFEETEGDSSLEHGQVHEGYCDFVRAAMDSDLAIVGFVTEGRDDLLQKGLDDPDSVTDADRMRLDDFGKIERTRTASLHAGAELFRKNCVVVADCGESME